MLGSDENLIDDKRKKGREIGELEKVMSVGVMKFSIDDK